MNKLISITTLLFIAFAIYSAESMRKVEYIEPLPENAICYFGKAYLPKNKSEIVALIENGEIRRCAKNDARISGEEK